MFLPLLSFNVVVIIIIIIFVIVAFIAIVVVIAPISFAADILTPVLLHNFRNITDKLWYLHGFSKVVMYRS